MFLRAPAPQPPVAELIKTPGYAKHAIEPIDQSHRAPDAFALAEVLHRATTALGTDTGIYVHAIPEEGSCTAMRVMMTCDPLWAYAYAHKGVLERDGSNMPAITLSPCLRRPCSAESPKPACRRWHSASAARRVWSFPRKAAGEAADSACCAWARAYAAISSPTARTSSEYWRTACRSKCTSGGCARQGGDCCVWPS
jgi:hypothetical protein